MMVCATSCSSVRVTNLEWAAVISNMLLVLYAASSPADILSYEKNDRDDVNCHIPRMCNVLRLVPLTLCLQAELWQIHELDSILRLSPRFLSVLIENFHRRLELQQSCGRATLSSIFLSAVCRLCQSNWWEGLRFDRGESCLSNLAYPPWQKKRCTEIVAYALL